MKAKLALAVFLVAVLALTGVGCTSKVTGGGWFINTAPGDSLEHRITFGFNAQLVDVEDGTVKGQFQLIDHDAKTNIHGTFESMTLAGEWAGVCMVKGEGMVDGEYLPFTLHVIDIGEPAPGPGDIVHIEIGEPVLYVYSGNLGGGNIQAHE